MLTEFFARKMSLLTYSAWLVVRSPAISIWQWAGDFVSLGTIKFTESLLIAIVILNLYVQIWRGNRAVRVYVGDHWLIGRNEFLKRNAVFVVIEEIVFGGDYFLKFADFSSWWGVFFLQLVDDFVHLLCLDLLLLDYCEYRFGLLFKGQQVFFRYKLFFLLLLNHRK